jgi:hypothetical protein
VEKEILKLWPQAIVSKIEYSDPVAYRDSNEKINIEFTIPDFALINGKTILFTPLSAAEIFKSVQTQLGFETDPAERKYPFRDRCSRLVKIHETIKIPVISKVIRIPAAIVTEGKSASFTGSYTLNGNILEYTSRSVFSKRLYDAADWPEFRSAVEAQNKFAEKPLVLEL